MKIDFAVLDTMEAAGASAKVLIAFLRQQFEAEEARRAPKRERDKTTKRTRRAATKRDKARQPSDIERQAATLSDTPRARLFREGTAALITLGKTEGSSRGLIAGWLKATNDDEQLVLATILKAQQLAVADAPGWILATLKGRAKPNGRNRSMASAADDLIARAEEQERAVGFGGFDDTVGRS